MHHRTGLLRFYRKERGEDKTPDGYRVPRTSNRDVEQLTKWWDAEYRRARKAKPWHKDPDQRLWEQARTKIAQMLAGADPDAPFKDNAWFWNKAMLKLAIYLEVVKTSPSPTQLLIESFKETIVDRVDDARDLIDNAGKVVGDITDTINEAGEQAISGIKFAAIVGGSVLGAAIVLPPVVRAMRKKPENQS